MKHKKTQTVQKKTEKETHLITGLMDRMIKLDVNDRNHPGKHWDIHKQLLEQKLQKLGQNDGS